MDNLNYWPYTNIHELNLDWIIAKVKELDTRFTDDIETFVQQYINEHFAEWTVNANYDPNDETIIYTNGTGATLTAGDVIRFAIDNAFVNVKDPTARTAASNAADAAAAAQGTADDNAADIAAMDTAYKAADTAINNKIGDLNNIIVPGHSTIVEAINNTGYYKAGDTLTATFECIGRGVSSGTDLYTYVLLDKLVRASGFNITIASCPIYPTDSGAAITHNASGTVGNKSISGNSLRFTVPVNSASFGRIAYLELSATITFT